jgi:hypothetical protein
MDTQVLDRRFLLPAQSSDAYISATMDDYSAEVGDVNLSIDLRVHDGYSVSSFCIGVTDKDELSNAIDFLESMRTSLAVVMRELELAFMDAKIKEELNEKSSEQDEEVEL